MRSADPITPPRTSPATGPLTRRRFLTASSLAAAALALYSLEIARHELETTRLSIKISNLPSTFHGFRIAHISDIHFEDFTEPFFLHRIIAEVNALAPDLILLPGDFITHGPPRSRPESSIYIVAEALRALTCPLRFASLGNHDCITGASFIARVLREHGTPVLLNQHTTIERGGDRLTIAGVLDPVTSAPNLDEALPPIADSPIILMAHAPDYADFVRRHPRGRNVDLMLAGHSHGGQVRLPILGPMILPLMGKKYVQGYFRLDRLQLYVSRGLGAVGLPFRLNCPPEITILTLEPA